MKGALLFLVAWALPLEAQDVKKQGNARDFTARVEAAINQGIVYLQKTDRSPECPGCTFHSDELILLTFVHAGVPPSDPKFQRLLKKMLASPLDRTYNVSLQAMALEQLDRVTYQRRIYECAQFLVDTQCLNGQWYYPLKGETTLFRKPEVVPIPAKARAKGESSQNRPRPRVFLRIKKTRDGPAVGDNSDSQYAALGLRACHDAGILIPEETVRRAVRWWHGCSYPEDAKGAPVATGGIGASSAGWGYEMDGVLGGPPPQGSMTVGAVGSLAIYDHILGVDWRKDDVIQRGVNWIANHFSVTENYGSAPHPNNFALYYYLYGLERAGILYGTEYFGRHQWYSEGAKAILEAQGPDGSWNASFWSTLRWRVLASSLTAAMRSSSVFAAFIASTNFWISAS
jgi:hypothetical protein